MQIYAFDKNGVITPAYRGKKQSDYLCLECQGPVRVRGGVHRRQHFYHLGPDKNCSLSGKSIIHLQVQLHLERMLPKGDVFLERPFKEINRIADVVWESEKLVFEVQCSPIKAQEALQRNRDYASLGYQAVWLLHDKLYNKKRLSEAEIVLRQHPHYFTNINALGKGGIYDQFDVIAGAYRQTKLFPLQVNLKKIEQSNQTDTEIKELQVRMKRSLYFEGDLLDAWLSREKPDYFVLAKQLERRFDSRQKVWWEALKSLFSRFLLEPFKLVFYILLEKACR